MSNLKLTVLVALSLTLPVTLVRGLDRRPIADVVQAIASVPAYRETAISPDHRSIAWVQTHPYDVKSRSVGTAIYWATAAGRADQAIRVIAIAKDISPRSNSIEEKALAWSPDSRALAFLSDAESPGQFQLYAMHVHDGSVRKLSRFQGSVNTPHWSPDGKTIAVLYTENSTRVAGPVAAVPPVTGVVDEQILEQRIALVDVASGSLRQVSPADLYVYEYDWSPDHGALVATAAHGAGDSNWYVAELFRIDANTGDAKSIFKPEMQIAGPKWSPDGRSIAFIGGLNSDEGIANGDVYLIPAVGGDVRNLTPGYSSSVFSLYWLPGSRDLLLADAVAGGSGLVRLSVASGKLTRIWQGAETIRGPADRARGISIASDGKNSAVIRESFQEPPSLWSGVIGGWLRVTDTSREPPALWGEAESVQWKSDEFSVQGWLLSPAVVDPTRRYPMIVYVHGGPAWVAAPWWPAPEFRVLPLASQGYFIFLPNPRGSAGFGEAFKRATVKDLGGGDLRDILAGVRHVVETKPIDDRRIGLTGWSHGGYMTMWAATQTQRFRAAVVGAGISNFLSYYGQAGIDGWMIPYFGASVYDDPAGYAKSSPINYVKNVRTPTLIVAGEYDIECPPPQSFEYWHALKKFGVPTQLVVYPREGHHFVDPVHSADLTRRMLDWFDTYMPAEGAAKAD